MPLQCAQTYWTLCAAPLQRYADDGVPAPQPKMALYTLCPRNRFKFKSSAGIVTILLDHWRCLEQLLWVALAVESPEAAQCEHKLALECRFPYHELEEAAELTCAARLAGSAALPATWLKICLLCAKFASSSANRLSRSLLLVSMCFSKRPVWSCKCSENDYSHTLYI